jgi:parafibromin
MGTEHDPLLALRQSIKSKSKITYTTASGSTAPTLLASTSLIINTHPFPKGTRTRFRRGAGGATDFYTLDAVYVAWLLRDAPGAEYMKQAREHGLAVGFVSVTERKHVVDWLEGKVQESDRIAPLACAYTLFFIFDFPLFIEGWFFRMEQLCPRPHLVHHHERLGRVSLSHLGHGLWRHRRRRL